MKGMIWVILAAVGVPLWLCALAITTLVLRNRSLRKRGGDVPCRLRREPGKRWIRGHAMWVHDVLAFRGSPAAWKEDLVWVTEIALRPAREEDGKLRRLGDAPVVAILTLAEGGTIQVAVDAAHADPLRNHLHPLGMTQGPAADPKLVL
jgi:hypothetical protein